MLNQKICNFPRILTNYKIYQFVMILAILGLCGIVA